MRFRNVASGVVYLLTVSLNLDESLSNSVALGPFTVDENMTNIKKLGKPAVLCHPTDCFSRQSPFDPDHLPGNEETKCDSLDEVPFPNS